MKKFCSICGKELPANTEYFLCEKCHKEVIISEGKFDYMENSRLYYLFLMIVIVAIQDYLRDLKICI
ncbi:MAG TPA: hypothetical protein VFH19_00850 [Nitrososphaeraceae archaeon]|nr:hypothetical protein [Nitrososphaeraceae archaeon]